jgi:hypothetical protein
MQQAVPEPAIGFALSMSIASALMKRPPHQDNDSDWRGGVFAV